MHLISALAAGVAGAENGTCVITKRGTSTKATYYTDFEGTVAKTQSLSSELSLDANGRLVAYVDEVVDIVCKSSGGVIVASFTDGASSPAMEVRSPSFTGTDYVTSASAAGSPTTLQAVLDLWKTNAGSIDWKVQGVTPTQLFNQTYTLVFNVKNYGATGDGSTDDTSFISAAITAAAVSGGVVFFPPGTYRITSALTLPHDVSLVGGSPETTAILMDHLTQKMIVTSGTSAYGPNYIAGLRLASSQANSGRILDLNSSVRLVVRECYFGGSNNNATELVGRTAGTPVVHFENCVFENGAAGGNGINNSDAGHKTFVRCDFKPAASATGAAILCANGTSTFIDRCRFNPDATTTGTVSYVVIDEGSITGCKFFNATGTQTCISFDTTSSAGDVRERDNEFESGTTPYSTSTLLPDRFTNIVQGSRVGRVQNITDNSAVVSIGALAHETVVLTRTANGAQTISYDAKPAFGSRLTVVIENRTGGAMTSPTFSAGQFQVGSAVSPGNGASDTRDFVFVTDGGGLEEFVQVGFHGDVTH